MKKFLYSVRNEQKEILELQDRIEELQLAFLPAGIRYDKDKIQVSPADTLSDRMAELVEYENLLVKKVRRLTVRRLKAQKMIDLLKDSRQRQVLDLYFLEERHMTIRNIAEYLGKSEQWVYNVYFNALKTLECSEIELSAMI